ncbi:OmpA/MotB family protein [Candidatus Magnetaquicoccus inordinatus]|uniref:OmpA/MotB family protein n=1 Tax=Candidatus Magnetaquicoccus inordinatus TaxID=2496818 RepID=UPI00102BF64F|nr:OmpA family protein [Candidatus Magnetaquicoccus inordinatus]
MYQQRRRESRAPQYTSHDYSIAISDVMSALLYVFIVILVIFAFNMVSTEKDYHKESREVIREREQQEKKLQRLEAGVVELRTISSRLKEEMEQRQEKTRQLLTQLLTDLQDDLQHQENLKVFIDPNHGILRLPNEILFPSGKAQFTPEGEENLRRLARVLERHLPCYAGSVDRAVRTGFCDDRRWNPGTLDAVFIEGHTDNIPLSKANPHSNNLHLSGMRAIQTFATLMGGGDNQSLLAELRNQAGQPVFGISGYGAYRPVVAHDNPTPDPANRRIDLRFFLINPKSSVAIPQIFDALDGLTRTLDALK